MSTTVPSPATSTNSDSRRPPVLTLRGIGVTFPDGTHAIDEVSFEVTEGEFVTVVGPSGCGKSTLLRVVSGLTPPTRGSFEVDPSLGYVFQDPTLLQWRTVRDNIELIAELHGMAKSGAPAPRLRTPSTSSGSAVPRRSIPSNSQVA